MERARERPMVWYYQEEVEEHQEDQEDQEEGVGLDITINQNY